MTTDNAEVVEMPHLAEDLLGQLIAKCPKLSTLERKEAVNILLEELGKRAASTGRTIPGIFVRMCAEKQIYIGEIQAVTHLHSILDHHHIPWSYG